MTAKPVKQNTTDKTTNENGASYSIAPSGEAFALPKQEDYAKEFKCLQKLVARRRKEGREIVVVMGVGFVGAVMAGIVADSVQKPILPFSRPDGRNSDFGDLTPEVAPRSCIYQWLKSRIASEA